MQVEARAAHELAGPPPRVEVPPVDGELDGAAPASSPARRGPISADVESLFARPARARAARPAPTTSSRRRGADGHATPTPEDSGAAVDALFARLRASHTVEPEPVDGAEPPRPTPSAAEPSDAEPEPASRERRAGRAGADAPSRQRRGRAGGRRRARRRAPSGAPPSRRAEPRPSRRRREPEPDAEPLARRRAAGRAGRDPRAARAGPGPEGEARAPGRAERLLDRIRTIKGKVDAARRAARPRPRRWPCWRPTLASR